MKYFFGLTFILGYILHVSSLICYYGISDSSLPLLALDTTVTGNRCGNDTCVCSSYKFVCTSDDSRCSTQQQQTQVQKSVWTVLARATCLQMGLNLTSFTSVTCCSTNYCNNQNLNAAISIKFNSYLYLFLITLTFYV